MVKRADEQAERGGPPVAVPTDTRQRSASASRKPQRRRARPSGKGRFPRRWWQADLLALGTLLGLLALLLAFVVAQAPTAVAFGVDHYPARVIFRSFYGVETNAAGAYRWAKPEAAISLPVDAPAAYRVVLTLGDSPAAPPRPVTVYINAVAVGTITPTVAPREWAFTYNLTAREWATGSGRTLNVEVQTAPFLPPGDQRALGVLLARVALVPEPADRGALPLVLLAAALVLAAIYAVLRCGGLTWRRAALVCGGILAGLALLAVANRPAALWLAYQPLALPTAYLASLVGLAMLAPLARAALHDPVIAAPAAPALPQVVETEDEGAFWSRRSLPLIPVALLGLGLRLHDYDRLNLWFDEGATILFAKLPWPTVLGFHGQYEPHPPLYYATVKLVTLFLPVATAGRLLSVVCGAMTVVVLYALAARLTGRLPALAAALLLAVSPLHIWYSQEARMYVPSVLLVAFSYLALVGGWQAERPVTRWGWAVLYGLAVLLAMYVVYSSLYALLPQVVILALLGWRRWRAVVPPLVALVAAGCAYLPWLPQVRSGVVDVGDRFQALGPTPGRVLDSLLATIGAAGIGTRGESFYPGIWERFPAWHEVFFLALLPAVALGTILLMRRAWLAALVAAALLGGTIATAVLVSHYSPGYAPRTVLYAVLGWSLLGGAAFMARQPRWLMVAGRLSFAAILVVSVGTLGVMYPGALKQRYRQAVAEASAAPTFGPPVVAIGFVTPFLDAYQPGLVYQERPYLAALAQPGATKPPALWLLYEEDPWEDMPAVRQRLADLGYVRVVHQELAELLLIDLFALPGATLGAVLPIDGSFANLAGPPSGWTLPPTGGRVLDDAGRRQLLITASGEGARSATLDLAAGPGHLYLLEGEVRDRLQSGRSMASFSCLSTAGATTTITTTEAPTVATSDWRVIRLAIWCPADTATLRLSLDNRGSGEVAFRNLGVRVIDQVGR